jgi:hypothetical protein
MDVLDTSLRRLNDIPTVLEKMLASDMKHSGFGRLNLNNYTSPSAESEGATTPSCLSPDLIGAEV